MLQTRAQSGRASGVTLLQEAPPSRETWTRPSSEPAQKRPACAGDSAKANMVP